MKAGIDDLGIGALMGLHDWRFEVMGLLYHTIHLEDKFGVGDYSHKDEESRKKSQFILGDTRSLDDVIYELTQGGYIPSFCTSCYRAGRTGEHFMEFAIPGFVKRFYTPNALLTFSEYLHDYSSERTLKAGLKLVDFEVSRIEDPAMKKSVTAKLEEMKGGKRDLFY